MAIRGNGKRRPVMHGVDAWRVANKEVREPLRQQIVERKGEGGTAELYKKRAIAQL